MKKLKFKTKFLLTFLIIAAVTTANAQEHKVMIQKGHGMAPAQHMMMGAKQHDFTMRMHEEDTGPVTFLGVHANPIDPTVSAQLGLPEHMGLTVRYVVPESPAEKAGLQPHDILRKMDDQILIHPFQLRVLVRSREEGEKVNYTVLRGGEEMRVDVELAKQEPAKYKKFGQWIQEPGTQDMPFELGLNGDMGIDMDLDYLDEDITILRQDSGRMGENVAQIKRHAFNQASEMTEHVINSMNGRRTILGMKNKEIILKDEEGDFQLTISGEDKHLKVTDHDNNTIFDGPINTVEEREEIPKNILPKLEKLESQKSFEFDSEEEFEPGDIQIFTTKGGMGVTAQNPAPNATRRDSRQSAVTF